MEFIKGITFSPFSPKGSLSSKEAKNSLKNLIEGTGANYIVLVPNALQETPQSEEIDFTSDATVSDKELIYMLSSGTTKGMLLYILMAASLQQGFDLIIDEIENHFHKTLVENMISLYKDKTVNRNNATLIFTTHYCELLDLFNRQDNIYIAKSNDKVYLTNMYDGFNIRSELLKSRQFYNNVFLTAVNYDELMQLKKELKVRKNS